MRVLREPTAAGVGDGRVVYFFGDAGGAALQEGIERDVVGLTANGFTVVLHPAPNRRNLREAFYGQDPELEGRETAAVLWGGRGARDGSLLLEAGGSVPPAAIEPPFVTHELDWVYFAGCRSGRHRALWQERLGPHVKIVATQDFEPHVPTELIHELFLPGGGGVQAVAVPPEDWEDEGDPPVAAAVADADEDTYWTELFGLLGPQRARAIEAELGMSTRQYVWRLGELLASAAVHQLQGRPDDAGEAFQSALSAGQLLTKAIPPLFAGSGDATQAVEYLTLTIPRSALGRGAARFGADHSALLEGSLGLLLLALPAELSDEVRRRLVPLGEAAGLAAELWEQVLGFSSRDLFAKGHARVFDALAGERKPRHVTRAMAFGYGRRLSMAGTMSVQDDPAAQEMLVSCQDMADLLGVHMPPKLERLGRYRSVADELRERHGPDHASLFDLAIQLVALRASYDPMSPETVYRLMRRLNTARKRANLPKRMFRLLDRMKEGTAPRSEGSETIHQLLQIISEHLLMEADAE